ncbi:MULTISPECIES: SLC13 family permease [Asticcacaulis]|uniref:SLC13 family permease n=1 Tax=Asticcacaulis TaxID=76890 RepID=UPI001AE84D71|nr:MULTISPECIES: SLC13 family permease [Asticcacaulis]MBP2161322.1 di/tricarboxylate transporter [Asticcacaulis solisilvae]MDR6802312.1 di/tricarboxylate transporter [Asticcacaulis sp. BE141]
MDLSSIIPAYWLSAGILVAALIMFVSEKIRHDLVALLALLAAVATGLVAPKDALNGFGDPAVVAVASVLVVGRALELSGVAGRLARVALPKNGGFSLQLAVLMLMGAFLSAFMNNIAALVIVMPLGAEIARLHKRPQGAVLMPLAFATILGGMTTLIGTPANMILSSVREDRLGEPFAFFAMTPVGVAVSVAGLAYLALVGWRLLPRRTSAEDGQMPWRIFELQLIEAVTLARSEVARQLRETSTRLLGFVRRGRHLPWPQDDRLKRRDRLVLLTRARPEDVAAAVAFPVASPAPEPSDITAHMVIGNNSLLVGQRYEAISLRSNGEVSLTGVGPRKGGDLVPMESLIFRTGDQLFLTGSPEAISTFAARERLLEVDRSDPAPMDGRKAAMTVGIFLIAIGAAVFFDAQPALAFLAAGVAMAALRLIPGRETYRSIDWSIIVLLAAMIPVGQSFETSGAAGIVAQAAGNVLAGTPLIVCLAAVCAMTLVLTIMLNNVATALIMGPLAIQLAGLLNVSPDAVLLAVLIGTSSDFLTPIGHQNNLLVMGPGGYKFSDYSRAGALLSLIVVATSATVLSLIYGG